VGEVAARLEPLLPKLASKPRKRRLEAVRRLVRRAEQRDSTRFTKRAGRELYVSVDALSSLLPVDVARLDSIDSSLADLHQRHRQLASRVNGHGSKIRDLEGRIGKAEELQAATTDAIAAVQRLTALQGRS
jgi:hypothetical protein